MFSLLNISEWRYERKFFITDADVPQVEHALKLHPAMFFPIYYERQVNNLYFDTPSFDFYNDNVIGAGNRLKVRIRWYGDIFGRIENPVLEIKCKDGLLGGKQRYVLKPFELNNVLTSVDLKQLFHALPDEIGSIKQCLLTLECSLLSSYIRKYFLSADKLFRATIDSKLAFYRVPYWGNLFLNKYVDLSNIILEVKYNVADDKNAQMITRNLPYNITKSSKYVQGLNHLFG